MPESRTLDTDYVFVCGYAGSGKSAYARALAKEFNANFIEVSDIVKKVLNSNRRSEIGHRPELDKTIIEELRNVEKPAVISGVRQLSIIDAFPDNPVVFVHVPYKVRQRRAELRNDSKDDVDIREADQMDNRLGLAEILLSITKGD